MRIHLKHPSLWKTSNERHRTMTSLNDWFTKTSTHSAVPTANTENEKPQPTPNHPDINEFIRYHNIIKRYNPNPHYIEIPPRQKEPNKYKIKFALEHPDTSKHWLTFEQAIEKMRNGYNIAIVFHYKDNLGVWDNDDLSKFEWKATTLTVQTPGGAVHQHKYLYSDGTVKNSKAKGQYAGCGEIRCDNQYVICPGSVTPKGYYRIISAEPIVTLSNKDIPIEWQPTNNNNTSFPSRLVLMRSGSQFSNHNFDLSNCFNSRGESYFECVERCPSIGRALAVPIDGAYNGKIVNDSDHDYLIIQYLLNQGFNDNDIFGILTHFRDRPKLHTGNYFNRSLESAKKSITQPRFSRQPLVIWG